MRNALSARTLTFFAVFCLAAASSVSVARAADRDFKLVVEHIKRQYHTSPKRMFAMGLAGFFVKVARPAGVKSIKLAVFENLDVQGAPDADALDSVLDGGLGPTWNPIVRVSSRRDGEITRIFLREAGKDVELLIISIDRADATVLKAKVSPESLGRWMSNHDVLDGNFAGIQ
jgi:hypothetical protein